MIFSTPGHAAGGQPTAVLVSGLTSCTACCRTACCGRLLHTISQAEQAYVSLCHERQTGVSATTQLCFNRHQKTTKARTLVHNQDHCLLQCTEEVECHCDDHFLSVMRVQKCRICSSDLSPKLTIYCRLRKFWYSLKMGHPRRGFQNPRSAAPGIPMLQVCGRQRVEDRGRVCRLQLGRQADSGTHLRLLCNWWHGVGMISSLICFCVFIEVWQHWTLVVYKQGDKQAVRTVPVIATATGTVLQRYGRGGCIFTGVLKCPFLSAASSILLHLCGQTARLGSSEPDKWLKKIPRTVDHTTGWPHDVSSTLFMRFTL